MRKYKDYAGREINEGDTILWSGEDGESEASAGLGNGSYYTWNKELKATKKGKKLVFICKEGKEWEWSEIDDDIVYRNYIYIKEKPQS